MRLTKKNLLITWFFSYILILAIPLFFSIGIYFYALNITKKETSKSNDALLTQVEIEIDGHIEEIYKMFEQISFDSKVQTTSNKKSFSSADRYNLYSIANDLKNYMVSNRHINDIFIYFNNTNTVIGEYGHMNDELFYNVYFENEEYTLPEFQSYMNQAHYRTVQTIRKLNGSNIIAFIQTLLHPNIGTCPSTIVISIDDLDIRDTLDNMKWNEENIVFILDGDNRIISATDQGVAGYGFDYSELEPDSEPEYKDIMGVNYAVSVKDSKVARWKYVTLTPDFIFEREARKIQTFTFTGLFSCILIGAFFSYFLAKTNYYPLKNIMDIFRKQNTSSNNEENEYKWLEKEVKTFLEEQKNTKNKLLNNKLTLRNYFISNLLKGRYDLKTIEAELTEHNVILRCEYNIVLLFSIEKLDGINQKPDNYYKDLSLAKFIVMNIFKEAASDHFNLELVDTDDLVAAIINLPENDRKFIELIEEAVYFVQQKVMEHFAIHITVSIGEVHKGMDGISGSYLEAVEAMEYLHLLGGSGELIYYHDIKNAKRRYYYPTELEQKIINYIKVGDDKMANALVSEVFEKNYADNKISADMGRCLIFDMLGTIVKVLDAEGDARLLEETDISRSITAKTPVQVIKKRFIEFIEEVCRHIREKNEKARNNALSGEVIAYIKENYQNPDLNISLTGLHFNLTPAYISRLFREQTGESLLNYINLVRINAAKELLQKGLSIVEVSERVGYRSSGTLIRIFKKITGVTPGQLKKTL